jgi:hypothetical protein
MASEHPQMAVGIVTLPVLLLTASSRPQDVYTYPAKRQSQEQQNRDRYECHSWTVKQTGFDPSQPQTTAADAHPIRYVCLQGVFARQARGISPHRIKAL